MSSAVTRRILLAGTALICLPAWADVPGALDRVPADATMIGAIRNLEQFQGRVGKLLKDLNVPTDGSQLGLALALVDTPGVNKTGSIAIALMPEPAKKAGAEAAGEGEEPAEAPMVIIVPVSDYGAFVKAFGGEAGAAKVAELAGPKDSDIFEGSMFSKDLGGGYAALSPVKELTESFDGSPGRLAAHTKTLGVVGARIADKADTFLISNIPALAPKAREGFGQMKQQAEMMLTMAGNAAQGAEGMIKLADTVVESFLRDAQVGVVGLGLDEGGVWMDLGAQFKEGSETAKLFQSKGNAGAVTAKLPDQPFILAFGFDTSPPGIKQVVKDWAKIVAPPAGAEPQGPSTLADFAKTIDTVSGYSMLMGTSPGMMSGGLFANSAVYTATTDPALYIKTIKESAEAMNGKTIQGMTYKSTYEPGAATISGVKVDKWSSQVSIDPNAPTAMQAQQMQMMFFGPSGGPAGFVAPVDKGVVMTMSQSTPLMTSALDSALGKKGLGENTDIKAAGAKLPADRTAEAYIGLRAILDMVGGFIPGVAEKAPAKIPPIALGAVTSDGGSQLRIYVPTEVISTIKGIAQDMGGGGEEEMDEEPPAQDGKPPRF